MELVALGARTPVGLSAESSAAAVRARISRLKEFPFVTRNGEPVVVAADARLGGTLEGRYRLLPLLESALAEVTGKLAAGTPHTGRCIVLLCLPEVRPGFAESDALWLLEALRAHVRARGAAAQVALVGRGHAGVARACEVVQGEANPETLYLVLAADSYHHGETFLWLERERRFAQADVRGGFAPGEAAACLALVSGNLRARLRLSRLATLRAARTAKESLLRGCETGTFGAGMTSAVLAASAGLILPRDGVDTLYGDLNGERYRSEEWGFVALRTPQLWKSLVYEAPADSWGDVGAASGALGAILAVQSWARYYARGPRAMVLTGSDSGLRGAMLLEHPQLQGM
jgi:3-oxoacyl-[acyl-carrier-protein] synthase-1